MITKTDRYAVERKYHIPEEEFNPFARMAYHGEGYLPETGLDDEGILQGLQALSEEIRTLPHPVARARAIAYVLEHERLYVNEHDWFVGLYSLNRLANTVTFIPWNVEADALRDPVTLSRAHDFNQSGAVAIWTDYDHVVPDWKSLMELGFPGILDRAKAYREAHKKAGTLDKEAEDYFDGIEIQYTAILHLLDRFIAASENQSFEKAPKIAACLRHLREGAPTDIYEAMQLIFLYFIISESVDSYQVRSLGNGLDATLLPFYTADLAAGHYTEEEIRDLLSYFLLQWSSIGNYWGQPFYLGGTNDDGSSKYNSLSLAILEVYDQLEIYNPKIQLKINENTPDWLLAKAFDMVRRKNASFVFCMEPGMIKAVMGYGASYKEALHMDIRGCYETGVRANEVCGSSGYVNAAMALSYVFTDGFDRVLGRQVGTHTGPLSDMETFDDFYHAFLTQWSFLIAESMKITNDAERFLAFVNPSSMYSATIETSLARGRDGYGGAVKFANSAMLNCSFATAVDGVLAVKEFVYDQKEITLSQLAAILEADWQGYEVLRKKIRKSPHKYGNNDLLADRYAAAMTDFFSSMVNNAPNSKGGVYKAILHSARQYVEQGYKTPATPDGRRSGEELSKNASPSIGMDREGVTASIASALALTPSNFRESFCLDLALHPSALAGEVGFEIWKSLIMTYLRAGGMSIQFNLLSTDVLRDAQEHPEQYPNLQIRICGWNTLWNNVRKPEQDAFIARSESIRP
ncbi:MAG: hypothetical protein E7428_05640 [Ruminococcaceae bacterium]|nr:hypothetical protein [Oscillospiraceae bacterium]